MCRAHDRKSSRADTSPESSLQRFSALTPKSSTGHYVVDCGARLAVIKALASLDPLRGLPALTTTLVERRDGSYVMAGRELGFSEDFGMRRRTTSPGGRLMDVHTAAAYLGCSYWTLRDLVLAGHIPAVRIPSPRRCDGRPMRRILIDSRDLDRLVEQWKEVDGP